MMSPKLTIKIFNKPFHSFHFFGATGYFLGLFTGLGLAYANGLALWPVLLCGLTGAGVLFGLAYLYKVITGREDLVYYQHEIAILLCCLALLSLVGQPVLEYLDITLVGIGIFLVFGRIGCFSVGCCHGRPHKHGVVYSKAHVEEGFPSYYQGIPIFPIQLVESASVFFTILLSIYAILSGSPPGTTLLIYSILYGAVRFNLEFFRGDPERPYWLGFSEAQWTTLGIFLISAGLSLSGVLPQYSWHLWMVLGLVVFMVGIVVARTTRAIPKHKLLAPRHVEEVAHGIEALEKQSPPPGQVLIAYTSLGLNISRGAIRVEDEIATHYTISADRSRNKNGLTLNSNTVEVIKQLLQTLRHPTEKFQIEEGQPGVFHILFFKTPDDGGSQGEFSPSYALGLRRNLRDLYH